MTAAGLVACKSWPFAATMLRKYATRVAAAMLDDDAAALVRDFAAAAIWHIAFLIKKSMRGLVLGAGEWKNDTNKRTVKAAKGAVE